MNVITKHFYEITPTTIAVIAERVDDYWVSNVMEEDETERIQVKKTPAKLVDFACKYFGSSLKGRQEGARMVCNIKSKVPISINPASGMYFFPTTSPTSARCSWISHTHVDSIRKLPNMGTEFIFKDGQTLTLDVSYGSMMNQLHRTAQFRYKLEKRLQFLATNKNDRTEDFFSIVQQRK
ncbi:competence protein ComK [Natronobacillus azotifigens]|uniref:Competence protein ComK n=1 Tax=Natronobacillus azotifigens TaxID=472978 RepID=A0A9J6RD51_9BACI|nr:competence protein ComK [Natronobacillus azotifigens]